MDRLGEVRRALEAHANATGVQVDIELAAELIKPVQVLAWKYSDKSQARVVITDLDNDQREVLVGAIQALWKGGSLLWPAVAPGTAWDPSGRWSPLLPQPMTPEEEADIQRRADDYLRRRRGMEG